MLLLENGQISYFVDETIGWQRINMYLFIIRFMNKTKRKYVEYDRASIRTRTQTHTQTQDSNITLDENDIGYLIMKLQTTN